MRLEALPLEEAPSVFCAGARAPEFHFGETTPGCGSVNEVPDVPRALLPFSSLLQ